MGRDLEAETELHVIGLCASLGVSLLLPQREDLSVLRSATSQAKP